MNRDSITQRGKGLWVTARLRCSSAKVGDRMRIEGRLPIVENLGKMELGRDLKFRAERSLPAVLRTAAGAFLQIGDGTYVNEGACIVASRQITIGSCCLIGDNAQIHDSDYHQLEFAASVRVLPITIGRNVWIGRNAIILPGVSIGDHSVIGAGSVVTKSVPAGMVFAGVPAKQIRELVTTEDFVRR